MGALIAVRSRRKRTAILNFIFNLRSPSLRRLNLIVKSLIGDMQVRHLRHGSSLRGRFRYRSCSADTARVNAVCCEASFGFIAAMHALAMLEALAATVACTFLEPPSLSLRRRGCLSVLMGFNLGGCIFRFCAMMRASKRSPFPLRRDAQSAADL